MRYRHQVGADEALHEEQERARLYAAWNRLINTRQTESAEVLQILSSPFAGWELLDEILLDPGVYRTDKWALLQAVRSNPLLDMYFGGEEHSDNVMFAIYGIEESVYFERVRSFFNQSTEAKRAVVRVFKELLQRRLSQLDDSLFKEGLLNFLSDYPDLMMPNSSMGKNAPSRDRQAQRIGEISDLLLGMEESSAASGLRLIIDVFDEMIQACTPYEAGPVWGATQTALQRLIASYAIEAGDMASVVNNKIRAELWKYVYEQLTGQASATIGRYELPAFGANTNELREDEQSLYASMWVSLPELIERDPAYLTTWQFILMENPGIAEGVTQASAWNRIAPDLIRLNNDREGRLGYEFFLSLARYAADLLVREWPGPGVGQWYATLRSEIYGIKIETDGGRAVWPRDLAEVRTVGAKALDLAASKWRAYRRITPPIQEGWEALIDKTYTSYRIASFILAVFGAPSPGGVTSFQFINNDLFTVEEGMAPAWGELQRFYHDQMAEIALRGMP